MLVEISIETIFAKNIESKTYDLFEMTLFLWGQYCSVSNGHKAKLILNLWPPTFCSKARLFIWLVWLLKANGNKLSIVKPTSFIATGKKLYKTSYLRQLWYIPGVDKLFVRRATLTTQEFAEGQCLKFYNSWLQRNSFQRLKILQ